MDLARFLAIFLIPAVVSGMSSSPNLLPLYDGIPPNHRQSDLEEVRHTGGMLRITKVQDPSIEVFLPEQQASSGKALVVCPGGGYGALAYEKEGTSIAAWLNKNGIAAVVLKYRLPEDESNLVPHQTPLLDAQRALRLTRHHAASWNIDPDGIGIMGFSAGGHLASTLGTRFEKGDPGASDPVERLSSRPDFMILAYPVITMSRETATHQGSRGNLIGSNPSAELPRYYSSELNVTSNTPPTFIIHASDDKTVPVENSLLFYDALRRNEIEAEMHLYPHGGHGFSLAANQGRLAQWPALCVQWIKDRE